MNTQAHPEISNPHKQNTVEDTTNRYGEFSPNDSIIQSCKLILKNQVEFIQKMTPVAIEGRDNEGIHKMRVGFRRIRTCLRILRPFIKKKRYKYFQQNTKIAGQVLGKVRDLDVLLENINDFNTQTHQDQTDYRFPYLDLDLSDTYNNFKYAFFEYISSPDYEEFHQRLENFYLFNNSGLKDKISKSKNFFSIKIYLPDKLLNSYSMIEQYGPKFQSRQPYHIYHSFRKDTKKFRYTLEFFSSLYNSLPYSTLVDELIVLQDQLGFLNDCVVAHEFLTEHLKSEFLLEKLKNIESIEKYISLRISEKNKIIESLPEMWETFQLAKPSYLLKQSLVPLMT